MQNSIGILGGTFDPIHLGHIQIAKYVFNHIFLKEIRFIPCFDPPHRILPVAKPKERLEMVSIAIKDYPYFIVDDREIKRAGKSYMLDTLQSLHLDFPDHVFFLILGFDAFAKLSTWHQWEKLKNYTHFVVLNRHNVDVQMTPEVQKFLEKSLKSKSAKSLASIYMLDMPPISISATQIREQLHQGEKPKDLDKNVYQYILDHKIYI